MEGYKDVMLSEPPSRFTVAPSTQPVNLETYKGILLCDRPQGAVARNDAPIPFLPAGRGDERFLGMQPTTEQRARLQTIKGESSSKAQSSNAIVAKHKRWLKNFAGAVKQAKLDKAENELIAGARAAGFRDRQAALRTHTFDGTPAAGEAEEAPQKPEAAPTTQPRGGGDKKAAKSSKPKWAMTEAEADKAEDDDLLADCDGLLQFAKDLDYDRFIHDMEVKEAMAILKERVGEILAEEGGDYQRDDCPSECPSEASTTTRAVYKLAQRKQQQQQQSGCKADATGGGAAAENDQSWDTSTKVGGKIAQRVNAEALTLADKILAGSDSMRQIHTRVSLAKVLEDAVSDKKKPAESMPAPPQIVVPTVVAVGADATGRELQPSSKRVLTDMRKAKDKTQNLPYLYRCPAM